MLIASRQSFWNRGSVSALDYVQDGLIYHLNCLENIGYGKFSNTTLVWKNLANGQFDALIQSHEPLTWLDCGCEWLGRTKNGMGQIKIPRGAFGTSSKQKTIEVCCKLTNRGKYVRIISRYDEDPTQHREAFSFGFIDNCSSDTVNGPLSVFCGNKSTTGQVNSDITVPKGEIISIAFSFASKTNFKFYLNEQSTSETTYYEWKNDEIDFDTDFGMTGKEYDRTSDIILYSLRVYDRMITDEEHNKNYLLDKILFF